MMKLFGHDTSPYVRRVRVLLHEMGITVERDFSSWVAPSSELSKSNPLMRVPVVRDGKKTLLDSKLIAEYLYAHYANKLLEQATAPPLSPTLWHTSHRFEDENIVLAIDAATDSAINILLLELDGVSRAQSPYLGRQLERVERCMHWLDQSLAGRTTVWDDVFSFSDIALHCALDWMLYRQRYPVAQHANLVCLLRTHTHRPSLSATYPADLPSREQFLSVR